MSKLSIPEVILAPQQAAVSQVVTVPQVVTEPKTSHFTSSDFYYYNHDFDEPNKSYKASDLNIIIDCVTSSGYKVRSSYQECIKLNDGNFNIRVNSKPNTGTDKQNELDIIQQNEDEYYYEKEKKTIPYTGTYYSKSPNDGYHGSLSRSNSLLSTTSESVVNSGSEHIPPTSPNEISTLTGGEIDTTDLYEPMDQINVDEEFDFQYYDDRNSIEESNSDYSLYNDQTVLTLNRYNPSLLPLELNKVDSPVLSLSHDTPPDDISDSFNPPHESTVTDNSLINNAGSTGSLDQSDFSDFDLEGEFPLPTSQTLPNLSFTEDHTEIFGSTQPNYGADLSAKLDIKVNVIHSNSMPTLQDQSDTTADEIQSSRNDNSARYEQSRQPSTIDEANILIVPEDQSGSEPSAEEMEFFGDEANEEDE